MPANNPYSSIDFNQDGDVSNLELAVTHGQSGEFSTRKKRPLFKQVSLGILVVIVGILLSFMGKSLLYNMEQSWLLVVGIIIAVIGTAYTVYMLLRHCKGKKRQKPD